MIRIAIVGGIGSGKSHLAKLFGYPIFKADLKFRKFIKKRQEKFSINLQKKLKNYFFHIP